MGFSARKSWGFKLGNTPTVEGATDDVSVSASDMEKHVAMNVNNKANIAGNPTHDSDAHQEPDANWPRSPRGRNSKLREPLRGGAPKSSLLGDRNTDLTATPESALNHNYDDYGFISKCLWLKHLVPDYQQWLPLGVGIVSTLVVISSLEPEQRDVLFSTTWGWFVGQEIGAFEDSAGTVSSSYYSSENIAVLGLPALVALGLSMLLAALGWLQECWSDVKARLVSRSALMAMALVLSLVSLMFVKTNADEVLLVALSLGWLVVGFFQRITSFTRVLVGRSISSLAPSAVNARVVGTSVREIPELRPSGSKHEAQLRNINVAELKVGDIIRLGEGEQVPCDGIVISGAAIVYEVRFSPLGRQVNRCENDRLFAGSRILKGEIQVRIEEKFGDNDLSTNLASLEKALNEPIDQDLRDYKLQRLMVALGFIFSACAASLHWAYFSSLSASAAIAAAMLMGLVVVSVPTFFFPIRRLCLLRAFKTGSFISQARSLTALSKIEHVVVDMPKGAEIVNCELRSFRILDDTLDVKATLDLILSLLARVELKNGGHGEYFWYSLHDAINKDSKLRGMGDLGRPVSIERFVLSNRGLQAQVEGLPVYFGDVQYLLENNVVIDVGDVPYIAHPERLLILAMGREAIASIVVVPTSLAIESSDLKKLREWGYKVSLISDADRKEVDLQGKVIGFDLGSIHGGMICPELEEKLRSITGAAIFSSRGLERSTGFLVVPFDDVRRDFEDGEITIFSRSLGPFVDLLIFTKQSDKLRHYLFWGGIVGSALSVIITISLPQLLWIGLLFGGLTNLTAYVLLKILSPKL